ncbi:hypothetical protein [Kamptonema sp. UHCC 0994]|uniref:hypothetical protein n=1 Tax=Kamptonema sp. UHCC 0994 TaxID=3031329 RepID=UPI0023B952E3|nr:hypothetical protein [Kamptonema sp. UHCC 0994]MDF0554739.1 hypothetical protein [Kamptonema sp. UHCC 0994]
MKTDFDYGDRDLFGPVVFRPDFNSFKAINANQAWSLFFTASREDKALGFNAETGRFFTYSLIATVVTGVVWASIFRSF